MKPRKPSTEVGRRRERSFPGGGWGPLGLPPNHDASRRAGVVLTADLPVSNSSRKFDARAATRRESGPKNDDGAYRAIPRARVGRLTPQTRRGARELCVAGGYMRGRSGKAARNGGGIKSRRSPPYHLFVRAERSAFPGLSTRSLDRSRSFRPRGLVHEPSFSASRAMF